jgi:hypothetical protein
LKKLLRNRGLAAVVGSIMLTLGAGTASAQATQVAGAGQSLTAAAPVLNAVQRTVTTTSSLFSNAVGAVFGTNPDPRTAELQKIAREGRWLAGAGWPLYALVDRYSVGLPLDQEANCLATAVYFEARGETLEGQLAVARVVMNRAASGKYPTTWCEVMTQPWQFSFVNPRTGRYPAVTDGESWRKAQGIARLAMANVIESVPTDVLWYHADYVSPSWGRRLSYVDKIGPHIFYRA